MTHRFLETMWPHHIHGMMDYQTSHPLPLQLLPTSWNPMVEER